VLRDALGGLCMGVVLQLGDLVLVLSDQLERGVLWITDNHGTIMA